MPYKICSSCSEPNGVRTLVCKKCATPFNGKRAAVGPVVQPVVKPAVKPASTPVIEDVDEIEDIDAEDIDLEDKPLVKNEVKDWRKLRPDEVVCIMRNSGSYYDLPRGERKYISDSGSYVVHAVKEDGIEVIGLKSMARYFIYMGKPKRSTLANNLWHVPHRLIKVN